MNIKKTLVISYRVLCVAVTLIEAADLGKTIYGKYKNNKKWLYRYCPWMRGMAAS